MEDTLKTAATLLVWMESTIKLKENVDTLEKDVKLLTEEKNALRLKVDSLEKDIKLLKEGNDGNLDREKILADLVMKVIEGFEKE